MNSLLALLLMAISLLLLTLDDNSTKKEAVADLASLFAGTGLAATASEMSVDLNELGAAADINVGADSIAIIDADDSNASKKETIADLMTAVAGDGLAASSGVLAVGVDDSSIETNGPMPSELKLLVLPTLCLLVQLLTPSLTKSPLATRLLVPLFSLQLPQH